MPAPICRRPACNLRARGGVGEWLAHRRLAWCQRPVALLGLDAAELGVRAVAGLELQRDRRRQVAVARKVAALVDAPVAGVQRALLGVDLEVCVVHCVLVLAVRTLPDLVSRNLCKDARGGDLGLLLVAGVGLRPARVRRPGVGAGLLPAVGVRAARAGTSSFGGARGAQEGGAERQEKRDVAHGLLLDRDDTRFGRETTIFWSIVRLRLWWYAYLDSRFRKNDKYTFHHNFGYFSPI